MSLEYIYLEPADIILAHKIGYETFGSSDIIIDYPCIEKKAYQPQRFVFDMEAYPGLFLKAAVYLHSIISVHCFNDGNKRAGLFSVDMFLKLNGYKLVVSTNELFDYCYRIADHRTRPDVKQVEKWIEKHAVRFDYEEEYELTEPFD